MTRNTLSDLNNHLFEQLERLRDASENDDLELKKEINRAKAITNVGNTIIANGRLALEASRFEDERLDADGKLPRMLE